MTYLSFYRAMLLSVVLGGFLSACTSVPDEPIESQSVRIPVNQLGNSEYQTYLLANELFASARPARHARYAVTGFVPVGSMEFDGEEQRPLMMLGHQLEQGLITEATNRGFTAQEFKLTNDIIISDDSDRVLSRHIEQLSGLDRVDFYITGTLVHQQDGAMVNARIIDARTKDIVAAATRFFPAGLFWEQEQVTTRNGRLYRTEDKG